ncbi:MAG: ATP-binding protein [Nitrospirota bacterium]|nr:ATP-binding protein [Nitrospirota bacterium]
MNIFWRFAVPVAALMGLLALLSFHFSENRWIIAGGRAVLIVGALVVAWRLDKALSKRVDSLVALTRRVARGERITAPETVADDDLGFLEDNLYLMDETIRERAEKVTTEKALLEGVLRGMAEGVMVLGDKGDILMINRAASAIYGFGEGIVSRPFEEVIRVPAILRLLSEADSTRNAVTGEVEILAPERRSLKVSCVPVRELGIGWGGIVMVSRDITAEKKVQRMKEDFIANVSHELKTPVASLKGFAETLLDGAVDDPETARRFLSIILSQSDRLGRLVNDLLTLSRIELKEQTCEPAPVLLHEVAHSVATMLKGAAGEKGAAIEVRVPEALQVMADRDALSQIILNLADNAIKFGREGGRVDICAEATGNRVTVSVADDGPGIPAEHISRLGERFYRVDASRSRELGGTGLGLAIVKHLIMAHDSEMQVTSELRKGTTFSFTLPVA